MVAWDFLVISPRYARPPTRWRALIIISPLPEGILFLVPFGLSRSNRNVGSEFIID